MNTISTRSTAASLGGKATALVLQRRAIEARKAYNAAPRHCLYCNSPLLVSLTDLRRNVFQIVKRKKFCSHSCACKYNNNRKGTGRVKPPKTKKPTWFDTVALMTKKELFARCKNWQSARSILRQHAVWVYNTSGRPYACVHCMYDKHVDIAHRKAVNEFPETTLIREINDLANLMPLCPNHHWEHDHLIKFGG
jgi:hypothetical protein